MVRAIIFVSSLLSLIGIPLAVNFSHVGESSVATESPAVQERELDSTRIEPVGASIAATRETRERTALQKQLRSVMELACACQKRIGEISDYSCTFVKQERIDGKLNHREFMLAKVRHAGNNGDEPERASIYLKYLAPKPIQGREVLFVDGQNDGKIVFRKGGYRLAFLTGMADPFSVMAMAGNRYPITEFGLKRLVERMIELGEKEIQLGDCEVTILHDATFGSSGAHYTCVEIRHDQPSSDIEYQLAKIFIDQELQVPVRFEAYEFPTDADEKALIKEEYTYCDLKLNVGLEDADFDRDNPEYGFR